mmetsp:Transcript_60081/g.119209  ORF Transcript_60081/g.119209 Transcript_60081/m.119209 type:complete len:226 (+) Transcript_60081:214-891(+)
MSSMCLSSSLSPLSLSSWSMSSVASPICGAAATSLPLKLDVEPVSFCGCWLLLSVFALWLLPSAWCSALSCGRPHRFGMEVKALLMSSWSECNATMLWAQSWRPPSATCSAVSGTKRSAPLAHTGCTSQPASITRARHSDRSSEAKRAVAILVEQRVKRSTTAPSPLSGKASALLWSNAFASCCPSSSSASWPLTIIATSCLFPNSSSRASDALPSEALLADAIC